MRLVSWNVNGIRSVARSGFLAWLASEPPDVLCLQETRAHPGQLPGDLLSPPGYSAFWHSAQQKGYSGVATLSREPPLGVQHGFGVPHFDAEGRVLVSEHPGFTLVNAYFPSGRRGLERVAFKLEFYAELLEVCTRLRSGGRPLVVCGDLNTAHQPIDLARPRENRKTSGFLPEERQALAAWLENGFVDVFRHLYPDTVAYTWWTNLFDARARNIGWRIDYFLVTEDLLPHIEDARILSEVGGSDHCPIELLLDLPPATAAVP
jgi:exodeoxyribonuclease-3